MKRTDTKQNAKPATSPATRPTKPSRKPATLSKGASQGKHAGQQTDAAKDDAADVATVDLATLRLNDRNPRTITEARFKALVKSIKDFPAMMALRPIIVDKEGVVLGGNMRYRALLELGHKTIPASWVKRADQLTPDEVRRFIVMDNEGFGEWDDSILSADFDLPELGDWGLDLEKMGMFVPADNKPIDEEAMSNTENECPKCGFKW